MAGWSSWRSLKQQIRDLKQQVTAAERDANHERRNVRELQDTCRTAAVELHSKAVELEQLRHTYETMLQEQQEQHQESLLPLRADKDGVIANLTARVQHLEQRLQAVQEERDAAVALNKQLLSQINAAQGVHCAAEKHTQLMFERYQLASEHMRATEAEMAGLLDQLHAAKSGCSDAEMKACMATDRLQKLELELRRYQAAYKAAKSGEKAATATLDEASCEIQHLDDELTDAKEKLQAAELSIEAGKQAHITVVLKHDKEAKSREKRLQRSMERAMEQRLEEARWRQHAADWRVHSLGMMVNGALQSAQDSDKLFEVLSVVYRHTAGQLQEQEAGRVEAEAKNGQITKALQEAEQTIASLLAAQVPAVRCDSLSPATSTGGPLSISLRSSLTTCSTEPSSIRLSGDSDGDTAIADASLQPCGQHMACGERSGQPYGQGSGVGSGAASGDETADGDTAIAEATLEPFGEDSAAASGDGSSDNTGSSRGDSSGHDSPFALLQLFKGQGKASRTPTRSAGSEDSSSVAGTTGTEALSAGKTAAQPPAPRSRQQEGVSDIEMTSVMLASDPTGFCLNHLLEAWGYDSSLCNMAVVAKTLLQGVSSAAGSGGLQLDCRTAGKSKPWTHPSLLAHQPQQGGMSDAELVGVSFGLHPEEICLHNLLETWGYDSSNVNANEVEKVLRATISKQLAWTLRRRR